MATGLVALLLLSVAGLAIGSSNLTILNIPELLLGKGDDVSRQILFHIRWPRVLAAILSGVALSVSGAVIQTVIRNPLGSPYTLGLSAASMFGAALAIVLLGYAAQHGIAQSLKNSPYLITLSAFIWGMACTFLITGFARWRGATPETLIMAGIILSALFGSATSLMQYISSDVELAAIVSWMFGDLGKATNQNTMFLLIVIIPSMAYFIYNTFNLSSLNAGDEVAASLGINVNRLRMITVLTASLCTAVTVAFFGVIAFVGLIIPHVTRRLVGFNETYVITGSAIFGALFLLASDIVARTIVAPVVIPVGIITSFIGAPFFLYLLFNRIKKR
ncbi:FecCD family ABC transporter permease [Natronoflexus pectinivorans]|uniref:Iron complex transport system permease protein n=1 Tax=Natronoflexus pectinivorans TaxID=682526 RepID=A0A4R2GDM1_9BACT|nr:iron ABC transporter permease [Natronoflexus pectinivorans]TCO05409.1 iron complex transport system permease protein [Natronoflexus pectinivorans]